MAGRRDVEAGSAYVRLYMKQTAFDRGMRALRRSLASAGDQFMKVGKIFATVGGSITAVFALTVKSAAEMQEVMGKFNTVFGESAVAVKKWGDEYAAAVGRSKKQTAEFLAASQDLFIPLGFSADAAEAMSKQVTQLAVDLASFNNKADSDVLRDLQAALTGSGETMKKYGVIVSMAATKLELLNMGLDPKTATEAQKAQARLNLIMAGTQAAQGDAIRTAGSFTNQMKALRGSIEDAADEIGSSLLPIITPLVTKAVRAVKVVGAWVAENKEFVISLAVGGAAIAGLGVAFVGIGATLSAASVAVGGFIAALPAAPFIAAIGAAVVATSAAWALWGKEIKDVLWPALLKLKEIFVRDVLPALKDLGRAVMRDALPALKKLAPVVKTVLGALAKMQEIQISVAMKAFALWAKGIGDSLALAAKGARAVGLMAPPKVQTQEERFATPSAARQAQLDRQAHIGGRSDIPRLGGEGRERQAEREAITEAERQAREIESFFGDGRNTPGEQSAVDDFFAGKESETPEPEESTAQKLANWIKYAVGVVGGDKPPPPETAAAAAIGPHGTFSTSAALAMSGAAGGGPEERTAKSTEALVTLMTTLTGLSEDQLTAIKNAFTFK